jgi:NitT/TauT family transport system permease protein
MAIPLGVLSFLIPLAIWIALRATDAVSEIFLPGPAQVIQAGRDLVSSGDLQADTWASVRRIGLGFSISLAISIPLGLAMGTFKSVNALFEPIIGFVRYMPATAFVPLLLIWQGIDEAPKITLIVIGTIFFNTLMIANTVWAVPSELIRVASTLGAGNFSVFRKVIFPYSLPGIMDAARVNLAAAWNLIVVAEVLAANEGLGRRIASAGKFLNVDQIFVVLIVIGVIGLTTDIGLRMLRNRLSPWSQE